MIINKCLQDESYFFSRNHTGFLRGIAIVIIVTVHFLNAYTSFKYLSMFAGVGVSLFLIISGFGINESYKRKGFDHYFIDKFIKIYIPCLISFIVFSLINGSLTGNSLLKALAFIGIKASWYLQFLFILYIIFFISAKLLKEKRFIVFIIIPILILFIPNQTWAEQAISFSLGMLFSHFDLKEKAFWNKKNISFIFVACLGMAAICFIFRNGIPEFYLFKNILWMIFKSSLAVVLIILTGFFRYGIINNLFSAFGFISFAVYLIHLYVFELVFNGGLSMARLFVALIIIIIVSYLFTVFINCSFNLIKSKRKN